MPKAGPRAKERAPKPWPLTAAQEIAKKPLTQAKDPKRDGAKPPFAHDPSRDPTLWCHGKSIDTRFFS